MEHLVKKDLGMRSPKSGVGKKYRWILVECISCHKDYEVTKKQWDKSPTKMCKDCSLIKRSADLRTVGSLEPITKKLYQAWADMKGRCYNRNHSEYHRYGERGILVCEEWKNSSKAFIDWSLQFGDTSHLSIDRIDNDKGYSPENCRWTDKSTKVQNTRILQSTNTSGYRGVSFEKRRNTWAAKISVNNKHIRIGTFTSALDAAIAYNKYIDDNNLSHTKNIL